MQLLPRLLLDRLGISLERLDLVSVLVVILLQDLDITFQLLGLGSFGSLHHHAVRAEHPVQKQPARQQNHAQRGQSPTRPVPSRSLWATVLAHMICDRAS